MKKFSTLLKIEMKQSLRCPDAIIFGICMPVLVLLLIGGIWGNNVTEGGYTLFESSYPSLITVGICATAFMGIPLAISDYREKKILKHYFVTPISPIIVLFVEFVKDMITALVSAICVSVAAKLFFGYSMKGNIVTFILAYFLVLISMFSIGSIIASVCKNVRIANVVTSIVYFPMLFLSGAVIPFEIFPEILRNIASILPLTQGIKLLKSCALNQSVGNITISLSVLIISLILGIIISLKTFKWE